MLISIIPVATNIVDIINNENIVIKRFVRWKSFMRWGLFSACVKRIIVMTIVIIPVNIKIRGNSILILFNFLISELFIFTNLAGRILARKPSYQAYR